MNELALFAGAGGGILGSKLLGWRTICAVEINAYAAGVLAARQNDGILKPFPIWDDIRTFNGAPWRGRVDVVSGGFPCQDISIAGKGAGLDGERSGLWGEMRRVIREVMPEYVEVENSPALTIRGLGTVLADLAAMGFDAKWGVLGADECGAPHERKRIWIVAHSNSNGRQRKNILLSEGRQKQSHSKSIRGSKITANASGIGLERPIHNRNDCEENANVSGRAASRGNRASSWESNYPEPGILGMDDALAYWMDRIKAIGNGQVPIVAATAWNILKP